MPRATPSDADADPVVAHFDARAGAYDRQVWTERRALRRAALYAGPLRDASVVDLAAGTGALAAALVDRGPVPASVTLVDGSAEMLARARARLAGAVAAGRIAEPRVVRADVRQTGLSGQSARVLGMGYLLHLLGPGERDDALAEARRLLVPGGTLVAVVHGVPRGPLAPLYLGAWRLAAARGGLVGTGPMTDPAADLRRAGLRVRAERRVAGPYWSHVLRAVRPRRPVVTSRR